MRSSTPRWRAPRAASGSARETSRACSPTPARSGPTPAGRPRRRGPSPEGRRRDRPEPQTPPGSANRRFYNRRMGEPFEIRAAAVGDLEAVNDLYNHYVRESHVTFDIVPVTMAARREWFTRYGTTGRYRLLVGDDVDDRCWATPAAARTTSGRPTDRPSRRRSTPLPGCSAGGSAPLLRRAVDLLADEDVHRVVRRDRVTERRIDRIARTVRVHAGGMLHRARTEVRPVLGRRVVRAARRLTRVRSSPAVRVVVSLTAALGRKRHGYPEISDDVPRPGSSARVAVSPWTAHPRGRRRVSS